MARCSGHDASLLEGLKEVNLLRSDGRAVSMIGRESSHPIARTDQPRSSMTRSNFRGRRSLNAQATLVIHRNDRCRDFVGQ